MARIDIVELVNTTHRRLENNLMAMQARTVRMEETSDLHILMDEVEGLNEAIKVMTCDLNEILKIKGLY
ncbi:hypothetical protein [Dehalobacter sp. TeCB1]|uniref:hypothetical protein n=1 Tax=Dehalobacter sp. TeCB1 TaxID=1843715 RepID=UPI00083B5CBE|nr:hypothetical protein [Dehalobacter sp. TeCB1]OCZ54297.1 hypothetical protein A7D23_05885 [Dehalobacter sp. TeCB1]